MNLFTSLCTKVEEVGMRTRLCHDIWVGSNLLCIYFRAKGPGGRVDGSLGNNSCFWDFRWKHFRLVWEEELIAEFRRLIAWVVKQDWKDSSSWHANPLRGFSTRMNYTRLSDFLFGERC